MLTVWLIDVGRHTSIGAGNTHSRQEVPEKSTVIFIIREPSTTGKLVHYVVVTVINDYLQQNVVLLVTIILIKYMYKSNYNKYYWKV